MQYRTYYSALGEARKGLAFTDKSLTRQEFLHESLTSTIIERFARTGILCPNANPERQPMFGDFGDLPTDLLDAHERLESVRAGFGALPAKTRAAFGNNPLALVQFLANPANKSKAVKLGLIPAPVMAKPSKQEPLGDNVSDAHKSGQAKDNTPADTAGQSA